jgi:RND superfamily putative drug exporter
MDKGDRVAEPDSSGSPGGTVVERLARWSVRHRGLAIGGWFALVLVAMIGGTLLGPGSVNTLDPGESGRAQREINKQSAFVPAQENVLITSTTPGRPLTGDDAARRAAADLTSALTSSGAAAVVRSPFAPGNQDLISPDGTAGLLTWQIVGEDDAYVKNYDTATAAVRTVAGRYPDVRLDQAGDRSLSLAVDDSIKDDFSKSEVISLPLTLIILLIVFGSLIAAGIPLLLAGTAVAATFGLLQVIDNVVPVNSATSSMILLIGMAVGVDYTLFYLRREREERHAGRSVREALHITARTSGRVVLVSGVTVMLCVCGLLLTGLDVFKGLTAGAVLVVGFAMLGSVTVLPALLSALGRWVDRARIPWLGRRRTNAAQSRLWNAVAQSVVRRPALWGGLAALALLVVALPALGMHLQDPARTESLPRSIPTVGAALRMQEKFPGASAPAWVVVWRRDGAPVDTPDFRAAVTRLRGQVAGSGGAIAEPISVDKVDRVAVVRRHRRGFQRRPAAAA